MEIEVYTFKDKDGQEFGTYFTQDIEEAKEYARDNKLRVIANTFVWDDSEETIQKSDTSGWSAVGVERSLMKLMVSRLMS
jgi:hypothetical protein